MASERRLSLETVHQVLATFGIAQPTPLYERRVKPDGMSICDLHEVLSESPFVFTIDWRASLPDELALIAAATSELGTNLHVDVAAEVDDGWVACDGKRERVKYVPNDEDDFTDVIAAVQRVVPPVIEFREATSNGLSDGWEFAVLLHEEWLALEALDPELTRTMFQPLSVRRT